MITKINKLSITSYTKMTKIMKYAGDHDEPQVSPGTQFGGVSTQSYISLFQSSPVEIAKRRRKL